MGSLFSGGDQTQKSTSTSASEMYQQEYFDQLLGGASDWLAKGGLQKGPDYTREMEKALGAMGQQYRDVLSGESDQAALNAALTSQADMAQQNLERNIMPNIGTTSNLTGGTAGSRRGIAEGLAASDMSAQLQSQQAQTINQFQQQEQARKMAAAQGMGNLFGQMGQLQTAAQGQTEQAKQLQSLLAFQNLISGNMGGTTTSTGTGTASGGGPGALGGALGAASTVAGIYGNMQSDVNLKKNVKRVKRKGKKLKTKDGIDVVEWEWNDKAKKKYNLEGKSAGVLAQEAKKKRPDAVSKKQGDYVVNYGKLM